MLPTKIPGFGYSDSEEEPERPTTPPKKNLICYNKETDALDFITVPGSTTADEIKKMMCFEELTEEEAATFGVTVEESEIDWDDDDYIDCDLCNIVYRNSCKHHPLLHIPDKHSPAGSEGRAANTLPNIVKIEQSKISNAGLGVFATSNLPRGFVFGPYQGISLEDSKMALVDGYCWEIKKKGQCIYLDGSNEKYSNWMRYINHSVVEHEQNTLAFQHHGSVYYRIIKPIEHGEEILVYYGESFNKSLSQGGPINPFSRSPKKIRKPLPRSHPFIL